MSQVKVTLWIWEHKLHILLKLAHIFSLQLLLKLARISFQRLLHKMTHQTIRQVPRQYPNLLKSQVILLIHLFLLIVRCQLRPFIRLQQTQLAHLISIWKTIKALHLILQKITLVRFQFLAPQKLAQHLCTRSHNMQSLPLRLYHKIAHNL